MKIEDLEKVKSETITKTFDGSYMSHFITVSKYKPEFNINYMVSIISVFIILINSYLEQSYQPIMITCKIHIKN